MNILQVVPELKSGGVERGTVDFAKYLAKQGHRSVIVSAGGPLVNSFLDSGVVHYTLPVHRKSLWSIWKCSKALSTIIRKENIEIVHARSRVPGWAAYLACRRERIPFITTCHGIYNAHPMSKVMGWGKLVISISHAVSLHMKERFRVPHHRIRLIHRGVNLDEFTQKPRELKAKDSWTIGIVGRITPIKGHAVLIKAMARVLRIFPNVKLVVVGEAPRQRHIDELKMLARRLGIRDRVEFLGTRYDIAELLRKIDVLVAPAVGEEAFGRVLIEAGACGVPVIASRIGGIVDVVDHGKNGMLVPAGDISALSEAITEILKNPEFAARLSKAAREKVEAVFNDKHMFERTLAVYREAVGRKKILVIKLSALGDVILSIPAIRALRRKFPNAHITAVVERPWRPILRNCPYLDDIIAFDFEGGGRWSRLLKLGKFLAKEQYDVCVDLQNNRASHVLSFLSGAHTRIGYANGKFSFLLNSRVRDMGIHLSPIDHQFQSLKLLGFTEIDRRLELWTRPEDDERVERFLKENWVGERQALVGMNPAASAKWATKQWLPERYAELCDRLSEMNVRVIFTGDASSAKTIREILRLTKSKPINAAGKTTVSELIALIRRCKVFITSDSAPMHVASAVGTPFVAIFGPTDPRRHLAASEKYSVVRKELKCSPCYLRKCPIGLICMKKIGADEVTQRVTEFLKVRAAVAEASA